MNLLKQLLTVVAFGYLCYHIYTFGPGMFNVTVLVILVLSAVANYFREKRDMLRNIKSSSIANI